MLRNVRGRENWCIAYRGPARSAGSGSKASPGLFSGPWRVPFMNSRLTMLRNGTLTLDYVPLRDIKCNVNPEHVNNLLGFAGYNESSKKGIDHAHI